VAKDLIALIDGTGNQPDDRLSSDPETEVTNVFLLGEALEHRPGEQEVGYFKGIATGRSKLGNWFEFNFGLGWNRKRNEARRFIRETYQPGDRLFVIGFSRGAAIARDLANELDDEKIRTFAMLLFESVGAFGLPTKVPGIPQQFNLGKRLEIPGTTRHVHHALALDEMREPFSPTLCRPRDGLELEEVWFAGDHADVGGGRKARALAEVTRRWAVDRLGRYGLRFVDDPEAKAGPSPVPKDVVLRKDFPRLLVREVRCHPDSAASARPKVHRSVEALVGQGYEPLDLALPLASHYTVVD
jgi:uncharacterized protein (DUF2235 family)